MVSYRHIGILTAAIVLHVCVAAAVRIDGSASAASVAPDMHCTDYCSLTVAPNMSECKILFQKCKILFQNKRKSFSVDDAALLGRYTINHTVKYTTQTLLTTGWPTFPVSIGHSFGPMLRHATSATLKPNEADENIGLCYENTADWYLQNKTTNDTDTRFAELLKFVLTYENC